MTFEAVPKCPYRVDRSLGISINDDSAATNAVFFTDIYWRAAHRQIRRIADGDLRMLSDEEISGAPSFGDSIYADVHVYLSCWRMIELYLGLLARIDPSGSFQKIADAHAADFAPYRIARNHLEHSDDRMPGQKDDHKTQKPNDTNFYFGNLINDFFEVGDDDPVDVRPESLELLDAIVTEIYELAAKGI